MVMCRNVSLLQLLNEAILLCCVQIEIGNTKASSSVWKMEAAVSVETSVPL
jgi:hypothetical protein